MSGPDFPFLAKLKEINPGGNPMDYLQGEMRQNLKAIQQALALNSKLIATNDMSLNARVSYLEVELANAILNINNASAQITFILGQLSVINAQIAALQPSFAASADVVSYTNSSAVYSDITLLNINTTGKPVIIFMMPTFSVGTMLLQNTTAGAASNIRLVRNATVVGDVQITGPASMPAPVFYDQPATGTHTYRIQGNCPLPAGTLNIAFTRLVAIEV